MGRKSLRIAVVLCALLGSDVAAHLHFQESAQAAELYASMTLNYALGESFSHKLADGVEDRLRTVFEPTGDIIEHLHFRVWVFSRVKELSVVRRDPRDYGPWEAEDDFYTEEAADDGSLTQWSERYFIVHSWAPIGEQILSMQAGDSVRVNEYDVQLEGVFDYPRDGYLDEIEEIVGTDDNVVVLQTCEPDQYYYRIVYGHAR